MIDYAVIAVGHAHAVKGPAGNIAQADAEIADNHIVRRIKTEIVLAYADSLAGGGLPGYGEKGIAYDKFGFEGNKPRDIKYYGPRPLCFDCSA